MGANADWLGFARIRRVVACLVATILAVVVGGVTVSSVQEYEERTTEAQAHAQTITRAIEPYLGRILGRTGDYLDATRTTIEAEGLPKAMPPARLDWLLAQRPADDAVLRYLFVSDASGQVIASGGSSRAVVPSIRDRSFFTFHRDHTSRDPHVGMPFRSRIDGHWRLPISVRLDDPDGTFAGVLNTALEAEYLGGYLGALGLPPGAIVHMVTDKGETLARHPRPAKEPDPEQIMEALKKFRGNEGPFRMTSPVNGQDHIGGYRKLGELPIYSVVSFTADSVFEKWRRNTAMRVMAGIGGLVVTVFFTMLLTRQLRAEQVAAANLAKFRRAVDLSGDYIYWVDAEGHIPYMNDAAARRLGLDPVNLPSRFHVRDLSPVYTEEKWASVRQALLDGGETTYLSVHTARDGSRYPVQVSATHVAIDGHDFGFLISRDLSEQVRQEGEIRELNATLEQRVRDRTAELADANGELEAFAYSVSHDLRAPLNHLTAYAESLAEVGPDDRAEALRLAGKIVERTAYMNDLVDALLVLSRVSRIAIARMTVDVSEIAADIAAEHRKLDPARDVAVTIQPGMRATADPMLVRTLLENLIGNAWKYSSKEPHARIEVTTEAADGGGTVFVVRDNGAGFDPRYAARLFGPFVRLHTQAEFKGNGVGLATARRIVSRHGGRIWAESKPGAGATFRFTLP